MPLSCEFTDPRLVAVYDTVNAYDAGTQPDFYLDVAASVAARSVIEVGCGTGLIAERFVVRGYDVVGVEPALAMLRVARSRRNAERARWLHGDLRSGPAPVPGVRPAPRSVPTPPHGHMWR